MTRLILSIALLTGLVIPTLFASPAHAAASRLGVPVSWVVPDPCTGEAVAVSGTLWIQFEGTSDANGGVHGSFMQLHPALQGTGLTSGTRYVDVGGGRSISSDNGSFGASGVASTDLISQGGTDNFRTTFHYHFVILSSLQVVGVIDSSSETCLG